MEFKEQGISLTRKEAQDLRYAMEIGIDLDQPWRSPGYDRAKNNMTHGLLSVIMGGSDLYYGDASDVIEIKSDKLPIIADIGQKALIHSDEVVSCFCSQFTGCSTDYYPWLEPAAREALASIAAIVERHPVVGKSE